MASTQSYEYGAKEQSANHIIMSCPTHPPHAAPRILNLDNPTLTLLFKNAPASEDIQFIIYSKQKK